MLDCLRKVIHGPGLLHLLTLSFPLAAEADPEGKKNKSKVEPERLFADTEEIMGEFVMLGGKEK